MLDRRSLKDGRQRKLLAQPLLDEGEQTHRQQGVSSQLEEIVCHPDRSNAQNLLPDLRELAFQVIAGRDEGLLQLRPGSIRRRQCPAVHLPVGRHRQGIEQHDHRRHHGLGQLVLEKATQLIGRGVRDHIGHQPLLARRVLPRQDHGLPHGRVLAKRGLDFSQFDAKPADLHLMVGPAEELDVPIGPIAGQVAGLVHSCAWLGAEGVRNKLLGGQVRPVQIPSGQARSADMQMTVNADRNGVAVLVQNVDRPVGEGTTDGHALIRRASRQDGAQFRRPLP